MIIKLMLGLEVFRYGRHVDRRDRARNIAGVIGSGQIWISFSYMLSHTPPSLSTERSTPSSSPLVPVRQAGLQKSVRDYKALVR